MLHCVSVSRPSSCKRAANSVFPVFSVFEKKWDTVPNSPAAKDCQRAGQAMRARIQMRWTYPGAAELPANET